MAFDKTLPSDTTKIRQYPTVLPGNFAGIQEADSTFIPWAINLADRTATAVVPIIPARIDNTVILFSDTASSKSELFILDAQNPANQIQMSEDGSLGSTSTQINASGLAFDVDATTGLTYTDGQLFTAFGKFNSSGVFQFGTNMSQAGTPHPSTGLFNVNVNSDILQNSNYVVIGNVSDSGSSSSSVKGLMPLLTPAPVVSTATTIQVEVKRDGGRTDTFDYFFIAICGGR